MRALNQNANLVLVHLKHKMNEPAIARVDGRVVQEYFKSMEEQVRLFKLAFGEFSQGWNDVEMIDAETEMVVE